MGWLFSHCYLILMEYLFLISSTTQGYPDHISLKIFLIFILEGIMSKYLVLGWHIVGLFVDCKVDFNEVGSLSIRMSRFRCFPLYWFLLVLLPM